MAGHQEVCIVGGRLLFVWLSLMSVTVYRGDKLNKILALSRDTKTTQKWGQFETHRATVESTQNKKIKTTGKGLMSIV